jgi:hypothetical protein
VPPGADMIAQTELKCVHIVTGKDWHVDTFSWDRLTLVVQWKVKFMSTQHTADVHPGYPLRYVPPLLSASCLTTWA